MESAQWIISTHETGLVCPPSQPTGTKDGRNAMINMSEETLISLREAPKHLPPRPNGKRVHISACYRWISRGVRGVHLESIKIGGSTYTSKEALQRFADRLSRAGDQESDGPRAKTITRQKQIERASARLAETLKPMTKRKRT